MKARRLLNVITDELKSPSLSPSFPAYLAQLMQLANGKTLNVYTIQARKLLRDVESRELRDLAEELKAGLVSKTLHSGSVKLRRFSDLIAVNKTRMIADRPKCYSEANRLFQVLQSLGLVRKLTTKKVTATHHPTLDDGDLPRPMLVFAGAFEMNRRRH